MKHVVGNFSAGLTDIPVGDGPNALEHLNWHVKEDGSLVVRDGCDLTFARLPSGANRVAWLGKFEGSYFAVCGKNVYVWVTNAWVTLAPFGVSSTVFAYGDFNSIVSAAIVGRDLVLCTTPATGDAPNANVPMRVIYYDNFGGAGVGGWTTFPLGLPPVSLYYDTSGYAFSTSFASTPITKPELNDSVVNWGMCFCYSISSRGRQRDFYGPLYSWQLDCPNGNLYGYLFQNKSLTGATADIQQLYYLPQPSSVQSYAFASAWVNQTGDRYPSTLMKLAIFRSKVNSSQLYWYYSLGNTQAELSAWTLYGADPAPAWFNVMYYGNETFALRPELNTGMNFDRWATPAPFVDGQVDLDCAPPMNSIAESNGFLLGAGSLDVKWSISQLISGTLYGAWSRTYEYRPERVRQAIPGMPDYWPRSFYVDLDAPCNSVGGVNGIGFGHTSYRTYRLDGSYDQFGSGGLRKKLISDAAGCTSFASFQRFGQKAFWLGDDGFYWSDGVEVRPCSINMRTSFANRVCSSSTTDGTNRRIFWVLDTGSYVCYPEYGVDEKNLCFVKWDGPNFLNSCFLPDGGDLYRGRTDGEVVLHDGTKTGDCDIAYEASYRTPFVGFGNPIAAKHTSRVDLVLDNAGSPFTVHLHSFKDSKTTCSALQPIDVSTTAPGSERAFLATRAVVPFKRYLRSSDLRCFSRSVRASFRGPYLSTAAYDLVYVSKVSTNHNFSLQWSGSEVGYFLRSPDGGVSELGVNNDDQFILTLPSTRRTGVPIYLQRPDGVVRLVSIGDEEHLIFSTVTGITPTSVYLSRPDGVTRKLCLDNDDQLFLESTSVARPVAIVVGSLVYLDDSTTALQVTAVSTDTFSVGDHASLSGFVAGDIVSDWTVHGMLPVNAGMRGIVIHALGSSDNIHGGES